MSAPQRVQRQRTKGWRKPEGSVYVGRGSAWGNPWKIGDPSPWGDHEPMDAQAVVALYQYGLDTSLGRAAIRSALAGSDLMCWCPLDQPCHADVLLALANGGSPPETIKAAADNAASSSSNNAGE